MYIGLRQISPATVGWLGNECLRGGVTRSGLARGLSGREGWLTHDGRPSTVTGMRVLPLLAEEPGLTLPEAAPRFASSSGRPAAALHALAWRATRGRRGQREPDRVSIHALAWRATGEGLTYRGAWVFQSTPSHGGRRDCPPTGMSMDRFQSTPSHGGRPGAGVVNVNLTVFQSTPSHGGRHGGESDPLWV